MVLAKPRLTDPAAPSLSFLNTRALQQAVRPLLYSQTSSPQYEQSERETMSVIANRDIAPMSPPSTTATPSSRLSTPTAPVVIPVKGQHDATYERSRHGKKEKRMRNVHSPDAVPPSVAALLALTSIPPSRGSRRQGGQGQRLTVNAILEHTRASEKQLGISLGKSHLHLLLSPPEEDPEVTESETGCEFLLSRRTTWSESVPSLEDDGSISEAISEASPSFGSPVTIGFRGRRPSPKRKQSLLLPLPVPSEDHPLSVVNVEEMDFRVFRKMSEEQERPDTEATPHRKSAFKSNLTASLRALKSAAKSFSSLTTPLITPDDFLTRSIISIDPQVPFTDERMPSLEDTPTPALRRYLNPTSNPPGEAHVSASIQMQTYKISRTGKSTSPSVISRRTVPTPEEGTKASVPFIRQRDMRENSDFIRVAVMEMLMRKKGKLDNQKPGRARWALPPRKPSGPYEISVTGIPARWVSVTI